MREWVNSIPRKTRSFPIHLRNDHLYLYIFSSMETWSAYAFSIHLEEFRFENKGGGGGEWRTKKLLSYFLGRTFWSEMKCGYSFLLFAFLFFFFFSSRLERYTRVLPWNNETGRERMTPVTLINYETNLVYRAVL